MILAELGNEKITSKSEDAFSLYEKSLFGEKKKNSIEYSFVEALFLVEQKKMSLFSNSKQIEFETLIKKIKKKDKRIEIKYAVYKDLRNRGYIPKTALKFGADFRVYAKGSRPGKEHAKWVLFVSREYDNLIWHDFTAKNRVAHSTNKKLLIAIVDEEGDVSYYEVIWFRP